MLCSILHKLNLLEPYFSAKTTIVCSMTAMKRVLIIGASGLVGGTIMEQLLADSSVEEIIVLARKSLNIANGKLREIVIDFDQIANLSDEIFAVDAVFSCLGTTAAKSDPVLYRKVEIEYPLSVATASLKRNCRSFHYVSSVGSSASSSFAYLRRKGEAENALEALQACYPDSLVASYRPSFILGPRNEHRCIEQAAMAVWSVVEFAMVGPLKKYRGIHAKNIAAAMIHEAKEGSSGFRLFETDEIEEICVQQSQK